jgi:hypothetical protein
MRSRTIFQLAASLVVIAAGALVSAQQLLPSAPPKQFGGSVTPVYEGWFDNPDGTHSFLIGYYSRNTEATVDVPIGPNNRFEPGDPDQGQPTHFTPSRNYGMFLVTVPKEFTPEQKLTWTLTVNGITASIPFHMHRDYNITPFVSSEESPDGTYNLPPSFGFEERGARYQGPVASLANAVARRATARVPMMLDIWTEDDAKNSSGSNTPMLRAEPPVRLVVNKYRGPGQVKVEGTAVAAAKGGAPDEPFAGKASPTVVFSAPGEYVLHVTANDYSGPGGGATGCCWTTALVKVSVDGETARTTGGQ